MSWLNSINREYRFTCNSCSNSSLLTGSGISQEVVDEKANSPSFCDHCGSNQRFTYRGFRTLDRISLTHNVQRETYEKNGRKAIKIGNTYMSETKYNYLENGKIENRYTPGYQAYLEKEAEKNEHFLRSETNKKRANVIGPNAEVQKRLDKEVASLPDGEYTVSIEKPA